MHTRNPVRWIGSVLAVVVLASPGCGGASGGGAARVPTTELDQYFVGTQVIRLPDGTEHEGGAVVAHRALRPEERTIVEEVVVRDAAGALESHAIRLEVDESDTRFVLREPGTPITGEGELTGEPWSWTAWHVQTRLPDGTVVVTDDTLSATDLRSESQVLGTDGTPRVVIRQVLTRVSRERYESERAAIEAPTE